VLSWCECDELCVLPVSAWRDSEEEREEVEEEEGREEEGEREEEREESFLRISG
jgi:hypothetical protein